MDCLRSAPELRWALRGEVAGVTAIGTVATSTLTTLTTSTKITSMPAAIVAHKVVAGSGRIIQVIAAARHTETKEPQTSMADVLVNNRPVAQATAVALAVPEVSVALAV
jgi:hypothetical protein